ncbi:MAG: glycosyltransferase family 4 protein [Verrucomicrobiota bacterium]
MRILFLHKNFPAQFRHLATAMGKSPDHTVVFATGRHEGEIEGVEKHLFRDNIEVIPQTHIFVQGTETAVKTGQGAYRIAAQLKARHFVPDIIFGHSGWGPTLFMKDAFPHSKFLAYFEWYYRADSPLYNFDNSTPLSETAILHSRVRNAPILTDLYSCDAGFSPTRWQADQFPAEYRDKIKVLHDGVDTDFFQPWPKGRRPLVLPRLNLDLSQAKEIVTYIARGMEPIRGFPQFMKTVEALQKQRPDCHFVICGQDRVAYGDPHPKGKSYKEAALEELDLDHSRIHFTGLLPYDEYVQVLQASSAHVYLTWPFVLSWSTIEAMSCGCPLIASDTEPVREVINDGENGHLVDFFDTEAIAAKVGEVLDHPQDQQGIRQAARQTVLDHYDLARTLPQQMAWLQSFF